MEPLEWIAGIGAIISLIVGGISAFNTNSTNTRLTRENNDLQRQLAGQANQWSVEQWNRENAYNDPRSQVARLAGAGLNPAMLMSQGGLVNEAAASPAVTMANTKAAQIQNPMAHLDPLTFAQIANINAQTDKTKTETEAIQTKLPEEVQKLQNENRQISTSVDKLNQETENLRQQLSNMKEEQKNLVVHRAFEEMQTSLASRDFERKCQETDALVKKYLSDVKVNEADADLKKSVKSLNWQAYRYNSVANGLKLVGLELDNENARKMGILYTDQHTLNQDQHTINRLNSTLLGYDVMDGYVRFQTNKDRANEYKNGGFGKTVRTGLDATYYVIEKFGRFIHK